MQTLQSQPLMQQPQLDINALIKTAPAQQVAPASDGLGMVSAFVMVLCVLAIVRLKLVPLRRTIFQRPAVLSLWAVCAVILSAWVSYERTATPSDTTESATLRGLIVGGIFVAALVFSFKAAWKISPAERQAVASEAPAASRNTAKVSPVVLAAIIIGGCVLIATGVSIYFSPYQSCMRSHHSEFFCARITSGRPN